MSNTLEHAGVKGMKWGVRKPPVDAAGNLKAPSTGRTVVLGPWANSKKRYSNPAALKKRTQAGKTMVSGLLVAGASVAAQSIGMASSNPSVKTGANVVASMLNTASFGVGVAAVVQGVQANNMEKRARAED